MTKKKFDPESIDDKVAHQTQWTPLVPGGTNTTDYKYNKTSPNRVEFKASPKLYIAVATFLILGVGAVIRFSMEPSGTLLFYGGIGLGILFIVGGLSKALSFSKIPVFDLDEGYFWKDQKKPKQQKTYSSTQCRIDDIHAIQLIQERIQSSSGSGSSYYYSFEMNLVLDSCARINVVDHGTLSRIRGDAEKLSDFLDVPVWDAITRKS